MATSYANPGGTGDRTASITVTTNASLGSGAGTQQNLVDGAKANNTSDACWVNNSQGAAMYFKFDFGVGVAKLIQEAKWYQNGSSAQPGVWKWKGSNDDSGYTDLTTTFTLNGAGAGDPIGDLSANVLGYRYYKLEQTTNAGGNDTPWLWECEFKIDSFATDIEIPATTHTLGLTMAASVEAAILIPASNHSLGLTEAATVDRFRGPQPIIVIQT